MYTEQTLFTVLHTLVQEHKLSKTLATDIINSLQNNGILFRERLPEEDDVDNSIVEDDITNIEVKVLLPEQAWKAIENSAQLTGDSKVDTISRACILYDYIIRIAEENRKEGSKKAKSVTFDFDGSGTWQVYLTVK